MDLLKLEVGKTYQNNLNYPIKIVRHINKNVYLGSNGITYSLQGHVWQSGRQMHDHKQCLVKEVD